MLQTGSTWQCTASRVRSLISWKDREGSGSGVLEFLSWCWCVRREKSREQRRDGESGTFRRQARGATSVRQSYLGETALLQWDSYLGETELPRWDSATSVRQLPRWDSYFGETALLSWDCAISVRRRYFRGTALFRWDSATLVRQLFRVRRLFR